MKISNEMKRVLRIMRTIGAKLIWKHSYVQWLSVDGKERQHAGVSFGNDHAPAVTTVEALERRKIIELSYPPPAHKHVWSLTELGKTISLN